MLLIVYFVVCTSADMANKRAHYCRFIYRISKFIHDYYSYLSIPDVWIWNADLKTNAILQWTGEIGINRQ